MNAGYAVSHANTLARAMAIILPTDTIGQTWFPYGVSLLRERFGSYDTALVVVFALAGIGAIARIGSRRGGGAEADGGDRADKDATAAVRRQGSPARH